MRGVSKKILVSFLSLTMILSSMTFFSFAEATSTNLSVTASKETVSVGDTFTVTVAFKGGTIASFTGGIKFDKGVVEYVSYEGNEETEPGKVYLEKTAGGKAPYVEVEAKLNQAEQDKFGMNAPSTAEYEYKSCDLVTVTFKAIATGDADIKLYESTDGTDGFKGEDIDPGFSVTVTNPLSSIAVTTAPTKTSYCEGQSFDKTGMVVTATYADKTTAPVTGYTVSPSDALSTSNNKVTISYTEDGVTKTAEQAITVSKHTYAVNTAEGKGWHWTDFTGATVDLKCTKCNDEVTKTATVDEGKVTQAATCTEAGETTYTATLSFNDQTFKNTKVDSTKPAAKNHKWGTPTWSWTGYGSAKATFTCENDSSHTKQITVTATKSDDGQITHETTTAATCEKEGEETYTATVKLGDETYTNKKTEKIDALNHDYTGVTPTWSWNNDRTEATAIFACTRKGCSHTEKVTVTATSSEGGIITEGEKKEPTCTEKGEYKYTATVNFGGEEYQNTATKEIAKLNHDYTGVNPTWSWNDDRTEAKATFACKRNGCDHTEIITVTDTAGTDGKIEITDKEEPGCTTTGLYTYKATVNFNGAKYYNTATKTIAATGHKYPADTTVDWVWDGYTKATATIHCKNCENTVVKVAESGDITDEITTEVTCTTDGERTYTAKVTYEGVEFTGTKTKTIAHEGHDYQPTWNWTWTAADSATATFDAECTKCHDKQSSVKATVSGYTKVADPDCTTAGKTKATATVKIGDQTYTDENTTDKYPAALGHDYTGATATWTWNGYSSATAKVKCQRNGCSHEETANATITSKVTKAATCEEAGETTYTATVTIGGKTFTDTKVDNTTPEALTHSYKYSWDWSEDHTSADLVVTCTRSGCDFSQRVQATVTSQETKAASCTTPGQTTYTATATFGGVEKTDTYVDSTKPVKLGHNMEEHAEKAATCEEAGNTAYWYCTRCQKYFSDEEGNTQIEENSWVIEPIGHLWQKESYNAETGELKLVCVHDSTHTKTVTYSPSSKKDTEVVVGDVQEPNDEMKENGIESVDDIVNALNDKVAQVKGFENADKRCVEVDLYVNVGTESDPVWVIADKDIFPEDGIRVKITWDQLGEGIDKTGDFAVAHMYSTTMTGADGIKHKAGDVEIIRDITKTDDGIEFTVYSLSPFEIAVVPAGTGGGSTSGTDTGDSNNVLPFAMMLVIALGGAGVVYKRRRQ